MLGGSKHEPSLRGLGGHVFGPGFIPLKISLPMADSRFRNYGANSNGMCWIASAANAIV